MKHYFSQKKKKIIVWYTTINLGVLTTFLSSFWCGLYIYPASISSLFLFFSFSVLPFCSTVSLVILTCLFLDWQEIGVLRENPFKHRDYIHTENRKALLGIWTRDFFLLKQLHWGLHCTDCLSNKNIWNIFCICLYLYSSWNQNYKNHCLTNVCINV